MMSSSRVLPTAHEFVQRTLRDFRVTENGRRWVARLKGEGRFRSSVFPELAEREPQVLVELIPLEQWSRPNMLRRWLSALRLPYLSFSLLPLLLVYCASLQAHQAAPALTTFLVLASVTLIHLGCNLWSDYEDHLRGVDNPEHSGGSGVVQKLWIPAVHLRNSAAAFFLAGCALGLLLLFRLPFSLVTGPLFWLSLLGALGAASYSGWPFHYKYLGLGEPIVFFLSGPVVTMGASLILFRDSVALLAPALVSLPLAFLVVLRLHGGNMQRIPFDTMARVITIARALGFTWSKHAFGFLLVAPFLTVFALYGAGLVGLGAFVTFLSLPFAWLAFRKLPQAKGPLDPACYELRRAAARLHLAFGLLYSLSFLVF
jgi:1,4-dihydroxy-2-naphthoate octaprenyltransferase